MDMFIVFSVLYITNKLLTTWTCLLFSVCSISRTKYWPHGHVYCFQCALYHEQSIDHMDMFIVFSVLYITNKVLTTWTCLLFSVCSISWTKYWPHGHVYCFQCALYHEQSIDHMDMFVVFSVLYITNKVLTTWTCLLFSVCSISWTKYWPHGHVYCFQCALYHEQSIDHMDMFVFSVLCITNKVLTTWTCLLFSVCSISWTKYWPHGHVYCFQCALYHEQSIDHMVMFIVFSVLYIMNKVLTTWTCLLFSVCSISWTKYWPHGQVYCFQCALYHEQSIDHIDMFIVFSVLYITNKVLTTWTCLLFSVCSISRTKYWPHGHVYCFPCALYHEQSIDHMDMFIVFSVLYIMNKVLTTWTCLLFSVCSISRTKYWPHGHVYCFQCALYHEQSIDHMDTFIVFSVLYIMNKVLTTWTRLLFSVCSISWTKYWPHGHVCFQCALYHEQSIDHMDMFIVFSVLYITNKVLTTWTRLLFSVCSISWTKYWPHGHVYCFQCALYHEQSIDHMDMFIVFSVLYITNKVLTTWTCLLFSVCSISRTKYWPHGHVYCFQCALYHEQSIDHMDMFIVFSVLYITNKVLTTWTCLLFSVCSISWTKYWPHGQVYCFQCALYQEQSIDHMDMFIVFSVLYIMNKVLTTWTCLLFSVCSISRTKYWPHALIMLNYPAVNSLSERVRAVAHMQRNCVYLSKIENSSYYQELVSHPIASVLMNWVV